MDREHIIAEINAYQNLLEQNDHIPNKISEGLISVLQDATTVNFIPKFLAYIVSVKDEYGEVIANRVKYRSRINELEAELQKLSDVGTV